MHLAQTEYRARVHGAAKSLKRWIPVFGWMVLIWVASTDAMSAEHTSRFIVPLLHWFRPNISPDGIAKVELAVRKTAHLSEYAVLAIFFRHAMRLPVGTTGWGMAVGIVAVCFCYASLDEFHQSFVPSRGASARDVLIDTFGAAVGFIAYEMVLRGKRRATVSGVAHG